jgi:DegV family protein with EDD domain
MIHLVTDSSAYLEPDLREKYRVHIISLKICWEDQTRDEEGGITKEDFYCLLDDVATAPTTSQPSAGEFIALYEPLIANPDDEVISIHISEGLSGTVPNALAAAQELDPARIHVVDSRTAAIGLLIMVVAAGEAIAAGKSVPEILAMLDRMVVESCAYFTVENLAYLHKGGRIGAASRFLGTLLNIKPILYIHEGKIAALDKTRTSSRARRRVIDEVAGIVGNQRVRACIAHIQAPEGAAELVAQVNERLNCHAVYIQEVGPAIGSHVGPGFVGVAACPVGADGI